MTYNDHFVFHCLDQGQRNIALSHILEWLNYDPDMKLVKNYSSIFQLI